ncbi:hypothetical protein RBA41_28835 [Massilia sp. CCM 9210]|uniref:hypothetical protein n=1 Tax=Massilia scottii TaxID=3057166 RepID=UPI0027964319|nr:hypothetical protein [Massilia sp. CCM 9210]MDQ1817319.1 hypothetical protein [Massilia sp. CCM 9210]
MKKASGTNVALAPICWMPGGRPRPIWTVARREHESAACPVAGTTPANRQVRHARPTARRPDVVLLKAPVLKALFARVSFSDYRIGANFTAFCASFAMPISRKIPCAHRYGGKNSDFSRNVNYVNTN